LIWQKAPHLVCSRALSVAARRAAAAEAGGGVDAAEAGRVCRCCWRAAAGGGPDGFASRHAWDKTEQQKTGRPDFETADQLPVVGAVPFFSTN